MVLPLTPEQVKLENEKFYAGEPVYRNEDLQEVILRKIEEELLRQLDDVKYNKMTLHQRDEYAKHFRVVHGSPVSDFFVSCIGPKALFDDSGAVLPEPDWRRCNQPCDQSCMYCASCMQLYGHLVVGRALKFEAVGESTRVVAIVRLLNPHPLWQVPTGGYFKAEAVIGMGLFASHAPPAVSHEGDDPAVHPAVHYEGDLTGMYAAATWREFVNPDIGEHPAQYSWQLRVQHAAWLYAMRTRGQAGWVGLRSAPHLPHH